MRVFNYLRRLGASYDTAKNTLQDAFLSVEFPHALSGILSWIGGLLGEANSEDVNVYRRTLGHIDYFADALTRAIYYQVGAGCLT